MPPRSPKNPLEIAVLGELEVRSGSQRVELPPSKKTRALLAYLALTGRPQRRERLCSLLWDVADDPRGALRWSLSKLRKLLNAPGRELLVSDRELVSFAVEHAEIDVLVVRRALATGLQGIDTEALEALVARYRGELLEGMELSDFDDFQAWCVAEREQARHEHATVLRELVARSSAEPERAAAHARALVRVEPLDQAARAHLIRVLAGAGRPEEAEQHYRAALRLFKELGAPLSDEVTRAFQELRGRSSAATVGEPSREPSRAVPDPPAALVGRRAELAELERVYERAALNRSVEVVLLTGEPGAGKSRLLAECSGRARARATVLTGRAFEAERERPYGPWIDAMTRGRGDSPGSDLALLAAGFEATGEHGRERLFGTVADWIRRHAAERPVSLVFDDLQWWDGASAALLHHVVKGAEQLPLVVVLAAREGELVDNDGALRLVRSLRRDGPLARLRLGPLNAEETAELARVHAPGVEVERVFRESAGNPLFVIQLARADDTKAVAPTLHELIRDRLERLPAEAADVLRWCAVLGQTFGVSRLSELSALDSATLARALETLERHALVTAVETPGDKVGSYVFSHDVVRQVVHADLSAPRRRLMHHRVARLLAESGAPIDEIAHHASLAGDAGLAAEACAKAAKRALALFAPSEAYSLARRGMRYAAELAEPERTERMLELVETSYAARRPADIEAAASVAEELAERALDYGKLAHARRGFHLLGYLRWEGGDWSEAERRLLQAEMVSRNSEGPERVTALAEAARCLLLLERDLPQAEALSAEARATAERLGVESVAVHASTGMLAMHRGDVAAAYQHFERARALSRRDRDGLGEYRALEQMIFIEMLRDRREEACSLAGELLVLGGKMREGSEEPFARAVAALCGLGRGDESHWGVLERAIDALRAADAKHRLGFTLARAAELDLARGRSERAAERAREALGLAITLQHPSDEALARVVALRAARALADEAAVAEQERALAAKSPRLLSSHVQRAVAEVLPGIRA